MQDMPFDELKLRLSYGEVGNTAIDPYQTAGGLKKSFIFLEARTLMVPT